WFLQMNIILHNRAVRWRRAASLILAIILPAACGDDREFIPVTGDTIFVVQSPASQTVSVGATATFAVQVTGGRDTPTLSTCTSSNALIATVSKVGSTCVATGVSAGTAVITAKSNAGGIASSQLTVIGS
ncbi:MAG: hypothetical protein ABJB74_03715, partial [Gemmatimonas sp.]